MSLKKQLNESIKLDTMGKNKCKKIYSRGTKPLATIKHFYLLRQNRMIKSSQTDS
jgi:hypothetical protein